MFKKIILSLALLICVMMPANNVYANTVSNLKLGTSVEGVITEENQNDKYKIDLVNPGKITIDTKFFLGTTKISLLDSNGESISSEEVYDGEEENPKSYIKSFDLSKGTYYVEVQKRYNNTGKYTLKVNYKEAKSDSIEPNNGTETAQKLNLNASPLNGYITVSNQRDVYKVILPADGKTTIDTKLFLGTTKISLLDSNGEAISSEEVYDGEEENPKSYIKSFDLNKGTYYVEVQKRYNNTGKYTLKVNHKEIKNDSIEPNNGTETAQKLSFNSTPLNGYITVSNDRDVYKTVLPYDGKISINTKLFLGTTKISLLNSNGEVVSSDEVYGGSEDSPSNYNKSFDLKKGTYYVEVQKRYNNTGRYTVGASIKYADDQLYAIAYNASNNATKLGTQASINDARKAIRDLKGTKAAWAIGQFSGQVDKVQQKILVRIISAINKAEKTLKQADINTAKTVIDADLPTMWKNSYSSAVDAIQRKLMDKAIEAYKKSLDTKLQSDINAADLLIKDLKTSNSEAIVEWANAYFKR